MINWIRATEKREQSTCFRVRHALCDRNHKEGASQRVLTLWSFWLGLLQVSLCLLVFGKYANQVAHAMHLMGHSACAVKCHSLLNSLPAHSQFSFLRLSFSHCFHQCYILVLCSKTKLKAFFLILHIRKKHMNFGRKLEMITTSNLTQHDASNY